MDEPQNPISSSTERRVTLIFKELWGSKRLPKGQMRQNLLDNLRKMTLICLHPRGISLQKSGQGYFPVRLHI